MFAFDQLKEILIFNRKSRDAEHTVFSRISFILTYQDDSQEQFETYLDLDHYRFLTTFLRQQSDLEINYLEEKEWEK